MLAVCVFSWGRTEMRSQLELLGGSQSGQAFWKAPFHLWCCSPGSGLLPRGRVLSQLQFLHTASPSSWCPFPGSGLRVGQMERIHEYISGPMSLRDISAILFFLEGPHIRGKGQGAIFLSRL